MATSDGKERARELVRQIAHRHGFVREATLARMLPEDRLEVEEAMLMKDLMIGASVTTLVHQNRDGLHSDVHSNKAPQTVQEPVHKQGSIRV
jgi:hypothetical protein